MSNEEHETEISVQDAILSLGEATFALVIGLLPFVHSHDDGMNIQTQMQLKQLNEAVNHFGAVLVALGSTAVQAKPDAPEGGSKPSSLIIPK